jgi:drug/metabolite transporter (DMT)-like permease
MPAAALAFALAAACVHAGWNLALARRDDPEATTAVAAAAATVLFVPALWLGHVGPAAWPFVAGSAALELAYFVLLAAAYSRAELSLVYPLARGLAPVAVLALTVTSASAVQAAGVVLVAAGVLAVRGLRRARGAALALAVALAIAGYTVVDKHGVGHADPLPYFELVLLASAPLYLAGTIAVRGRRAVRAALGPGSIGTGIGMFAAYALVLEALQRAAAAPVAAVRESSVVIATALAAVVLREPVGPRRLVGAALVAAGVALVSLG